MLLRTWENATSAHFSFHICAKRHVECPRTHILWNTFYLIVYSHMVIRCLRLGEMRKRCTLFFHICAKQHRIEYLRTIYCGMYPISHFYCHNSDMMFKAQGNATYCALFFISAQSGIGSVPKDHILWNTFYLIFLSSPW